MNGNNQEKNSYVRRQILNTLLEMMEGQELAEISISALANRACVGRASFYRNFSDKEDVLRQEAERLTREWGREFERQERKEPNELLISLLDFYKDHSVFYFALHRAGLSGYVLDTILQNIAITPDMPNALAYLKSSIGYMIYGWVIEWMKRGMQESGTELAKMLEEAQKDEKVDL